MKLKYVDFKKVIQGRPSTVVDLMIKALEKAVISKHPRYKNFKLDMRTFGASRGNFCAGCAATCTLSELFGVSFRTDKWVREFDSFSEIISYEYRNKYNGYDRDDYYVIVDKFERSIDYLRVGNVYSFLYLLNNADYFGINKHLIYLLKGTNMELSSLDYKEDVIEYLSEYKELHSRMVKMEDEFFKAEKV